VDIATKSLHKAKSTITANGVENIFVMVQGKLKGNEIIECGLVAQVKTHIGKDTIIEGVREAVGGWNIREASPPDLFEKYNGFAKAVILRISETRDLGELSQHALYNKMKTYLAAPPPTIMVNEKYINQYEIINVCGVIFTSNYKETGLYLSPDDRRHHALWSERKPEDFGPEDFKPQDFTPLVRDGRPITSVFDFSIEPHGPIDGIGYPQHALASTRLRPSYERGGSAESVRGRRVLQQQQSCGQTGRRAAAAHLACGPEATPS
jgi:hypothetical protein